MKREYNIKISTQHGVFDVSFYDVKLAGALRQLWDWASEEGLTIERAIA